MAKIDEQYLDRLRAAGLHVSPPIPAFREGVWVGKPSSTPGNFIPNYEDNGYMILGEEHQAPPMDAPMLKFLKDDENYWMVRGDDNVGARGPGDFVNEWKTGEEAIEDILDFYFGDPKRMQEKAEARRRSERR